MSRVCCRLGGVLCFRQLFVHGTSADRHTQDPCWYCYHGGGEALPPQPTGSICLQLQAGLDGDGKPRERRINPETLTLLIAGSDTTQSTLPVASMYSLMFRSFCAHY